MRWLIEHRFSIARITRCFLYSGFGLCCEGSETQVIASITLVSRIGIVATIIVVGTFWMRFIIWMFMSNIVVVVFWDIFAGLLTQDLALEYPLI